MAQASAPKGNRRLAARRTCQLLASYQVKGHSHPATAMDLSRRGCRLRLGEQLARGTRVGVVLECASPDGGTAMRLEAEGAVVWSRLEGLSYQCGIHFLEERDEVEAFFELKG
jgi:hypothetical protein